MAKSQTYGDQRREELKEKLTTLLRDAKESGELTPEDEADILRYAREILRRREAQPEP